jgi:hypothetical protein
MKKVLFALLLLIATRSQATESIIGGGVYIDSIRVHTYNQSAYIYTPVFWGTGAWRIDLSTSNAFGRDMLALALSAFNTGKRIGLTVDVPADCSGSVSAPSCGYGSNTRSIVLRN